MTPTLVGRLQTRLLLALVVGAPVALLVGLLPGGLTPGGALLALALVTALGVGWECVYHLIQQRRWDGDWPVPIALGAGVVEALVVYPVLRLVGAAPGFAALMLLLASIWLATWLAAQGPVSVFLPHWRHQGARVVARRTTPATGGRRPAIASRLRVPRLPRPRLSVASLRPALSGMSLPKSRDGGESHGFRPTRQQLVVLGGVAAMAVAVVLLAPLVGSHDGEPMSTASAEHRAHQQSQRASGVRLTTWNTTHRVRPEALSFPAVGVHGALEQVRMTASGILGTPHGGHAAWFSQGAAPGQRGPAVIIGDSARVFSRLGEAHQGQTFAIARSDGTVVRFVVDDVVTVDAAHFPSRRVYGHSLKPLARLIGYDTRTGGNVIVFAHAVAVTAPAMRS